eukprot:TRINITY_DN3350_c0_g4_i3.p1 TRINITY_DN3350_c0_g4~~TRINITY_DN3350_c0_g4_i3.p1  ORF type:complete len:146 (-),score=9.50 TRINITY_DN3350_c0_g4_i3:185-622(-)
MSAAADAAPASATVSPAPACWSVPEHDASAASNDSTSPAHAACTSATATGTTDDATSPAHAVSASFSVEVTASSTSAAVGEAAVVATLSPAAAVYIGHVTAQGWIELHLCDRKRGHVRVCKLRHVALLPASHIAYGEQQNHHESR